MEITTRFSVGDKVYSADTAYTSKWIACPDCLGTLKWLVVFADGDTQEIACQTCKRGWEPSSGKIEIKLWRPIVNILTIGSVRYEGDEKEGEQFCYMCNETGVGSGRVYKDKDLFTSKEEAEKRADEKHQEQMKYIAENNFYKRFGGTKAIEDSLSTWGFSRSMQLEKVQQFRQWVNLSGISKKRVSTKKV